MTDEVRMFPEVLSALHYDSRIYLQGRSPQRQARFFETSIYLEDSGVLFIDGQPHTIHRGDVRFIPPGVTLCSDPPFSALSILLRFGPENEDYCRQFLEAIPPFFHGGEEMIDLFQQVIDLFSSDETGSKLLMNARMLKGVITVDGHTLNTVKEIRGFLQEQLDMGRRVLPMCDCDNFDYQTGCKGHTVGDEDGN